MTVATTQLAPTGTTRPQSPRINRRKPSGYWMRTVSFAGLHRILKVVGDFPNGLKAVEIDNLALQNKISLTRNNSRPKPTTLYHHRNTLLRLGALKRDGRMLRANTDDPDVCALLHQPAPDNGTRELSDDARERFAELILRNEQCRSFFFDLFKPPGAAPISVSDFRQNGIPVTWTRRRFSRSRGVVFRNRETGHQLRCATPVSVMAVLYGIRYWARDELRLIDEYCPKTDNTTIMFPVARPTPVPQTVQSLLDLRIPGEWTVLSIHDLVVRCCENRRQPRTSLFEAIDWLVRQWPDRTVLIPTSLGLATLTASSSLRENLELRRYYKAANGPYISHIRIHKDVNVNPREPTNYDVQHLAEIRA